MSNFSPSTPPNPDESFGTTGVSSWSPVRRELLDWFRRDAPSLAAAYEAAVFLVSTPSVPARLHLVCHIVRDIYNKLPEILDGSFRFKSAGESYPDFVEKIAKHWRSPAVFLLTMPPEPQTVQDMANLVEVPMAAARAVDDLLARREELHRQPRSTEILVKALFKRFAEAGLEPPSRLATAFEDERRWFTKRAHLARKEAHPPTEDELLDHFASFEGALHSLVGRYFTGKEELDAILAEANT